MEGMVLSTLGDTCTLVGPACCHYVLGAKRYVPPRSRAEAENLRLTTGVEGP
jgi:hypothetical protein